MQHMLYLEPSPEDSRWRRRHVLQTAAAFVAGGAAAAFLATRTQQPVPPPAAGLATQPAPSSPLPSAPTVFPTRKDMVLGCTFNDGYESDQRQVMNRHFNMLVPEYSLKMGALLQPDGRYDFSLAERELGFAAASSKASVGHTLVWHRHLPAGLDQATDVPTLRQRLETHIPLVVTRTHQRVRLWDVVNEAIHIDDGRADGLRKSPWLKAFGPDYVSHAFQLARASGPDRLLMYNDFDVWYDTPAHTRKRKALLHLLERALRRGAGIDVLGVQGHLDASETRFSEKTFARFLTQVSQLGLAVLVTELDVRDHKLRGSIAQRDLAVAAHARGFLDVVLAQPDCLGVVCWGLSDRNSWLQRDFQRPDGLPLRPLPFDLALSPKPLWHTLVQALDNAPSRSAKAKALIRQCLTA